MQSPLQLFIQRITPQIPMLLVLIAAIVFSILNWNRHRRPAVLTFAGATVQLLAAFIFPLFLAMGGPSASQFQAWNIIVLLIRAVGTALIVAAVFVERNVATRGFNVDPTAFPPPLPPSQH
jgi:hypothetical protein